MEYNYEDDRGEGTGLGLSKLTRGVKKLQWPFVVLLLVAEGTIIGITVATAEDQNTLTVVLIFWGGTSSTCKSTF